MKHFVTKIKNSRVLKNFLAMAGSSLALRPVQLLKEYMVARYLGPSDYGLLKSIELITMMNKYGSLGYKSVAAREAGDALGKGDRDKAEKLKSYSYAGELILSCLIFIIGLLSSAFFEDYRVSILIIFASFSLLASKISGLFQNEAVIEKNFYVLARVDFAAGLFASLLIILLVPFFKIYVVILMQLFVGTATIFYFYVFLKHRLTFRFDFKEILRASKIGVPIAINTLLLGAFKYGERILILTYLGKISLGFYSFALAMSDQLYSLFKLVMKVRAQDIFENLGRGEYLKTHKMVIKETSLMIVISIIIYPIFYYGVDFLIPFILPDWNEAIIYAQLLYLMVPIQTLNMYPVLVLSSSAIDGLKYIPIAKSFSVTALLMSFTGLYYLQAISLFNFSIIIVTSSTILTIGLLFFYKTKFVDKFLTNQSQLSR